MWRLRINVFVAFCSFFLHAQSAQLEIICKEGKCMWSGGGLYKGCIENAYIIFNFFDSSGVIDFTCTSVQVVTIENTNLDCTQMARRVITDMSITFYLGESQTECVSYYYLNLIVGGGGVRWQV